MTRISATKRVALARVAARRDAERIVTVRPVPEGNIPAPGATLTVVPTRSVATLTGWLLDDGSARGVLPSTADPEAVENRAAKAAEARDALAVATGRAYGSPVRGYRSRKGRVWPGYSPVVAAAWHSDESERSSAAVMSGRATR